MAIFYVSDIEFSSRSKGQSSVSSAAYIEDRTLRDERLGKVFRYGSDKTLKHATTICLGSRLPDGTPIETQKLWNLAEKSETRINARTSRHQWYALPIAPEIGEEEQRKIADDLRKFFEERYGVATTASIHLEHANNPHLHLQWTTREVDSAGNFLEKTRILDDKKSGSKECKEICKAWEKICNKYLAPEHHIDHRSYKERGLKITPALHLGPTAARMKRKGEHSDHAEAWEERERLREAERQELEELRRLEALELQLEKAKQAEKERETRELEDLKAETLKNFAQMEAEKNDPRRTIFENGQISGAKRESGRGAESGAGQDRRMDREAQLENLRRFGGNQPNSGQTHTEAGGQQGSRQSARPFDGSSPKSFGVRRLEGEKLLAKIQLARDEAEKLASQIFEARDWLSMGKLAGQLAKEIEAQQREKMRSWLLDKPTKTTKTEEIETWPQTQERQEQPHSPMMKM